MATAEPLRVRVYAATVAVIALGVALDILNGVDWKVAAARGVGSLILLLGGAETARAKVTPADQPLDQLLETRATELIGTISGAQNELDGIRRAAQLALPAVTGSVAPAVAAPTPATAATADPGVIRG